MDTNTKQYLIDWWEEYREWCDTTTIGKKEFDRDSFDDFIRYLKIYS